MATYKHLRSSTANKRPTTTIADGQLAINNNTTSAGLFFKDSTGATIIKIGPVHVGTTAPNATPGAGGSSGNSTGEAWLDTSLTPVGVKIWNGSAWVNGTPTGSTTVQGLLELATDVETQAGSDATRAVTPFGLQSKVSDSTSTTSSTTIASSTAVKSAFDLANAALPKSGGTVTGNLEIGTAGSLTFEGSVADGFETTIAVTNPTADRTITLPDQTGTVVTTGDTGSVTSTMLLDGTILNADVNASAAIAGSKISPSFTAAATVSTTGGDLLTLTSSDATSRSTVKLNTNGNDWEVGARGSTAAIAPNHFYIYDNTAAAYRLYIDNLGQIGLGVIPTVAHVELGKPLASFFNVNTAINVTSEIPTSGLLSYIYKSTPNIAASHSGATVHHFFATQGAVGGAASWANEYGYFWDAASTPSAYAYGFYSNYSGSGWNLYMNGTADSYIASNNTIFAPAFTETARFASTGLLIGTSNTIGGSGSLVVGRTDASAHAVLTSWNGTSNKAGNITIQKSRGTSPGGLGVVVVNGDELGNLQFAGDDGGSMVPGARVSALVDGIPGVNDMPTRLVLSTTNDGSASPTEEWRITNDGVIAYNQAAPNVETAAATLTVAELKVGIIQYTGAAATLTLPTGTLTEGGFSGIYTNMIFEWSVINTGSGTCTIGNGTGHTVTGSATVAAGASGRFASRRTAANTFVSYRLS